MAIEDMITSFKVNIQILWNWYGYKSDIKKKPPKRLKIYLNMVRRVSLLIKEFFGFEKIMNTAAFNAKGGTKLGRILLERI